MPIDGKFCRLSLSLVMMMMMTIFVAVVVVVASPCLIGLLGALEIEIEIVRDRVDLSGSRLRDCCSK